MYRKILAILLCGLMIFLVGCGGKKNEDVSSQVSTNSEPEKITYYTNNLTGEKNMTDKDKADNRPVAVMVNNISIAQKVQTGLTEADIVYETEVEGGITRLMAVFKDISKVEKIGTIRSARYPYIDLAMGHGAIYVHHGQDKTYAKPHLRDTQTFAVGENNAGVRIRNETPSTPMVEMQVAACIRLKGSGIFRMPMVPATANTRPPTIRRSMMIRISMVKPPFPVKISADSDGIDDPEQGADQRDVQIDPSPAVQGVEHHRTAEQNVRVVRGHHAVRRGRTLCQPVNTDGGQQSEEYRKYQQICHCHTPLRPFSSVPLIASPAFSGSVSFTSIQWTYR